EVSRPVVLVVRERVVGRFQSIVGRARLGDRGERVRRRLAVVERLHVDLELGERRLDRGLLADVLGERLPERERLARVAIRRAELGVVEELPLLLGELLAIDVDLVAEGAAAAQDGERAHDRERQDGLRAARRGALGAARGARVALGPARRAAAALRLRLL